MNWKIERFETVMLILRPGLNVDLKPGSHIIVFDVLKDRLFHNTFCQVIWTIKPGFLIIVFEVRTVSVVECFVKRSVRSYGKTLLQLFQTILTSEENRTSR